MNSFVDLAAVLETVDDRVYEITENGTFFHLKLKKPSNLVQTSIWKDSTGTYTTFISNVTGNLSFEHQIIHTKDSMDTFLVNFFLYDLTSQRNVPCSGYIHSTTENINMTEHKHTFNVHKNHHYAIGVKGNDIGSIKILKGTTLTIRPVLGSNSSLTGITTTRLSRSELKQVKSFLLFDDKVPNRFTVDMANDGNNDRFIIVKNISDLPALPYNLVLNFPVGIEINNVPETELVITVRNMNTTPNVLSVIKLKPDPTNIVRNNFNMDLGPINDPSPYLTVEFILGGNPSTKFNLASPVLAFFETIPIKTTTDTLLISGNHLSLNMGKEVTNPPIPFLLDLYGVTKPKNIQLIKYTGGNNSSYSSFVLDVDMEMSVTYFVEVTSNTNTTISFFISKSNLLPPIDFIPKSKLDIVLTPDRITKRFRKEFTLKAKRGDAFYFHCDGGGDFKIGNTTMLTIEEIMEK